LQKEAINNCKGTIERIAENAADTPYLMSES